MTFRPLLTVTIYQRLKAQLEYTVTMSALLAPNPAQPFSQTDWPRPASPGKVQASDVSRGALPLVSPNPAQPFSQNDWFQLRTVTKAKVDDVVNLLPVQTVVVAPRPFQQNDWLAPTPPKTKSTDTSLTGLSPLLSPNPAQPFVQSQWNSIAIARKPLNSDIFVNFLPIQSVPVVVLPFNQTQWPSIVPSRAKVFAESLTESLALYFPNPTAPFTEMDWPNPTTRPAQSDRSFTNAMAFIPAPPPPTTQTFEWIIRYRRRGRR